MEFRLPASFFDAENAIQGADRMVQHAQGVLADVHGRVHAVTTAAPTPASLITADTLRLWCVDSGRWSDIHSAINATDFGAPEYLTGLPTPGGEAIRVTNANGTAAPEDTPDADLTVDGGVVITLYRITQDQGGNGLLCGLVRTSAAAADETILSAIKNQDSRSVPYWNDGTPTWADADLLTPERVSAGAKAGLNAWWIAAHGWSHGADTAWWYWLAPLDKSRPPVIRSGTIPLMSATVTNSRQWQWGGASTAGDVALVHVLAHDADWLAACEAIRAHVRPWLNGLQHAHAGVDGISPGESHGWTPDGGFKTCSAVVVATSARTCSIRGSAAGDAEVYVTPLNAPGGVSRLPFARHTFDGSGTDDWNITLSPGRWLVQVTGGPSGFYSIRT